MPTSGWYYRLSSFFRERFHEKIFKIPLDAGFTCPNRDGSISENGCIFCYNPSFSPGALDREKENQRFTVKEQITRFQMKMETSQARGEAAEEAVLFRPRKKYLAYFQSYSNTYAPLSRLKELYEEALRTPGVIGLSIGTRPDCLSPEVLELLSGYSLEYHIWLELGLQSAHDRSLKFINRGHYYKDFEDAVLLSQDKGIFICVHIINGLPGETRADMLETIRKINSLPLDGIKFHQLQIFKETALSQLYSQGKIDLLSIDEYLEIICDQLEILRHDIVVHRLLSEATTTEMLLAPHWQVSRAGFSQLVERELKTRGSWQGKYFQTT
ncbi:MAG: TIGR01212 family radical SAM protein [Bacillota bacterium]|nr:TIGR01212 family radical SAM protein [Bacillota bacterium]